MRLIGQPMGKWNHCHNLQIMIRCTHQRLVERQTGRRGVNSATSTLNFSTTGGYSSQLYSKFMSMQASCVVKLKLSLVCALLGVCGQVQNRSSTWRARLSRCYRTLFSFSFESVNISRLPSFRFYWLVLCVCVCLCLCLCFGWLAAGICFRLGRG